MRFALRLAFALVILAGACLALPGCGSGGASVWGQLTNNGQPLQLSGKGLILLTFVPQGDQSGNTYSADVSPDGTFHVVGKEGKGLPPGTYKITVQAFDPYPNRDLLKGQFVVGKTPIVRAITGSTRLDLDLAKPQG
jgi:hypothetical protein